MVYKAPYPAADPAIVVDPAALATTMIASEPHVPWGNSNMICEVGSTWGVP
jgi:hypothetical protein